MKKLLSFIVCSTVILALSSCDVFNDKKQRHDVKDKATTVEGISQKIKDKIAAQDTLMSMLVLKVDTLAQALTQAQKENAELKAQVTKLESPKSTWRYMTLTVLVIAIIALVLSLSKKGISREEVDKISKKNLDNSQRMEGLKVDVSQLKSELNNRIPKDLDVRLQTVESTLSSKLNEVHNMSLSTVTNSQDKSRQSKEPKYLKTGYANINSGSFFTKILYSVQEGCVFSIKFKSAIKGEFNIISLDKIKSRNMWQEIVEYTGPIEDATSFNVEEYGICEKYDDVTWQVTKKLKIQLLK